VKSYVFQDQQIQKEWEAFNPEAMRKLQAINAKVPKDLNSRTKGIEGIIEDLMSEQFSIAKTLAEIEYFQETANAEALIGLYNEQPKTSVTILKEEAHGMVAQVTALHAFGKYVWQGIERALIAATSLLRKAP